MASAFLMRLRTQHLSRASSLPRFGSGSRSTSQASRPRPQTLTRAQLEWNRPGFLDRRSLETSTWRFVRALKNFGVLTSKLWSRLSNFFLNSQTFRRSKSLEVSGSDHVESCPTSKSRLDVTSRRSTFLKFAIPSQHISAQKKFIHVARRVVDTSCVNELIHIVVFLYYGFFFWIGCDALVQDFFHCMFCRREVRSQTKRSRTNQERKKKKYKKYNPRTHTHPKGTDYHWLARNKFKN
jgi:hypothetical protein